MAADEGYEIYSIGDAASAGLRVQFEYQSSPDLALAVSGFPVVRTAVVHNETAATLGDLTISGGFDFGQAGAAEFSLTVAGPHAPSSTVNVPLGPVAQQATAAAFQDAVEAASGVIRLHVSAAAGAPTADAPAAASAIEVDFALPVRALPGNEFLNWPELHAALAAFVRPNARSLTPILRAASELLMDKTKSGALDGYQSGPERAQRIAGALYEALRAKQLTYINPPASFEFTGQKVRTVDQVLADRFGTCIDLAVLYAAALEAVGLFPVLFITNGHAFTGYYADESFGEQTVLRDANMIANLVESGVVVPVELTGINPGSHVTFRDAVKTARGYIRGGFDLLRSMVDVARCRRADVLPLPSLAFERPAGLAAEQTEAAASDRPFVVRSSIKAFTLADEDEEVGGALDLTDPAPARVKSWKRDLLDLSLRNPLLNMPRNGKTLELLAPGGLLAKIDDAVHAGRKLTVAAADAVDQTIQARGIRVASELDPAAIAAAFDLSGVLYSAVDSGGFVRKLRNLQRDAETLEQETGSNYLYLAMGSLVFSKPNGGEAHAPLFLLPVRLTGNPLLGYRFEADPGEFAIPNLCLVEWLRVTKGVRFPALENPPTDNSGIAMTTVLTELRKSLVDNKLPFRIDETATLAILRFATFQIWRDLEQNWEQLLASPIVEHLVTKPGETFADPRADVPIELDEPSRRLAVPVDGSQLTAIARALTGQSFVLEGPPGTGKSQTITNLIAELMRAGKTVLFVAEKQAALEVVQRRLNAIGLGRFTLQLHGEKQSIGSIRAQLKAGLEVAPSPVPATWAADSARLSAVITELQEYPARVHGRNAFGLSLWEAHEQLVALGDGPVADIPAAVLRSGALTAESASRVTEAFTLDAARSGLRAGDPWCLVGPEFSAAAGTGELLGILGRLEAASAAIDAMAPEFAEVLEPLEPAAALQHAAYVASRRASGLVADSDLAAASAPGWNDRLAGFRARVAAFASDHAEVVSQAAPALFSAGDLGELHTRSQSLDRAKLFREWRRKGLRTRLGELTTAGWAAALPGSGLTPFLADAIRAAAESAQLQRELAALPGFRLPEGWAPWAGGALVDFDAAAGTTASLGAVHAALGDDGARRLLALSEAERGWLIEIAGQWRAWLAALHATPLTLGAWAMAGDAAGRPAAEGDRSGWLPAWHRSGARWRADLEASETLRPQRVAAASAHTARLAADGLDAFAGALQSGAIAAGDATSALLRGAAAASVRERLNANLLGDFDREHEVGVSASYSALTSSTRLAAARDLANQLIARRPFDPNNLRGEVAELRRQIERKRGGLTFRELATRYRRALQSMAPCFLMSPGSVAHYLPADFAFDVVVFDEASQIRVSQSIGSLGRGRSAVIAGDSKQMPPTRVMEVSSSVSGLDGGTGDDPSEEVVVEDLESILDEAVESGLPREWLTWHYRSHDERLIAFSNNTYYDGRLVTLPSPRVASAAPVADAATGLEWRRVDGVFDRGRTRTNEIEARAIVAAISARLADPELRDDSIGVVTFNIQQRDLILDLLEDSTDLQIKTAMARPAGEAIFVKNLENVQGDERDVILFSLAFSKDATGRLPLQFGPLILAGGERRLNVAITRARKRVVLFSSFDPQDIDLSRSSAQGLADLKHYLEFAAGGALPEPKSLDPRADGGDGGDGGDGPAAPGFRSALVGELHEALVDRGYLVDDAVGLSRFKVDLAVRKPGDDEGWRVAVVADGPEWATMPTVADRDGSPVLLESIMQWPAVERVWLPAWLRNRDDVLEHLTAVIEATAPFDPHSDGTDRSTAETEDATVTALTAANRAGEASPPGAEAATAADEGSAAVGVTASRPEALPETHPGGTVPVALAAAPAAPPIPAAAGQVFPEAATETSAQASAAVRTFSAFVAAATTAVGHAATLDNPRLAAPAIQRYAAEILSVEGPTSAERLAKLIAARFGLSRVVERRRTDILNAVVAVFATTENGAFVWPKGVTPDGWADVARTSPDGSRAFGEISLHELANGMVILLRQSFSMSRDELATETVRAFGYVRVTPAVRSRVEAALALGIDQGRMRIEGDRVVTA